MSKTPAMIATVNANTARREIAVVVEHADFQSFSRAVLPKARKEFKRWVSENIMFGSLAETGANLGGPDVLGQPRRCFSVVYFTY